MTGAESFQLVVHLFQNKTMIIVMGTECNSEGLGKIHKNKGLKFYTVEDLQEM